MPDPFFGEATTAHTEQGSDGAGNGDKQPALLPGSAEGRRQRNDANTPANSAPTPPGTSGGPSQGSLGDGRLGPDGELSAAVGGAGEDIDTTEPEPGQLATRTRRRRRGSRGGRGRRGATGAAGGLARDDVDEVDAAVTNGPSAAALPEALPGRSRGGQSPEPERRYLAAPDLGAPASLSSPAPGPVKGTAAAQASVPERPKIGDTRPAPPPAPKRRSRKQAPDAARDGAMSTVGLAGGGSGRLEAAQAGDAGPAAAIPVLGDKGPIEGSDAPKARRSRRRRGGAAGAVAAIAPASSVLDQLDDQPAPAARRGGERRPRPLGRYLMVVHVGPTATQIAVLEGRTLIEHYVSRPADDATQIDGNIYLGRVQNVLPGMEAAFVDIGTPKNAVLYRGDLRYDEDEVGPAGEDDAKPTRGRLTGAARDARIEQLLRTGQNIICQVTKNPIGTKGARLTQEVSLPGRFVVLIPESDTYGISKRLGDDERRRLRKILDDIRPAGHGLIVRTAAEGASAEELGRDVARLMRQWEEVQRLAKSSRAPQLLYREPDLAVRVIREEFNRDYRGVVIDDARLYEQVKEYVSSITPELSERVELVDTAAEPLPLFERFRVHEQVHKALDRKVWLPSGGSLIIERTEALTVIDVNTGKNVGTSNLEETVFRNNLEAAEEIARQLRLRDIGGIIVIDFIDMEISGNRAEVMRTFREALARDKTRSQVFEISELGLVEMTRKRISEGLVESYSETCPTCGGRGIIFDESLL